MINNRAQVRIKLIIFDLRFVMQHGFYADRINGIKYVTVLLTDTQGGLMHGTFDDPKGLPNKVLYSLHKGHVI